METIKIGIDGKTIECTLINKTEPEISEVLNKIKIEQPISQLIEKQRSNIAEFDDYTKITMIFPTRVTHYHAKMTRLTMIIKPKKLIIITSDESEIIKKSFQELKTIKVKNATQALSHLINSIREQSIHLFDDFEEYLNKVNKDINKGKTETRINHQMRDLYAVFYTMMLTLKGNTEVIKEILENKISYIKPEEFGEQQDDRALYFLELVQVLTELIKNNLNSYDARITERLNKQIYTLTILGAVLIVPTILSGYFGMNVKLPGIEFWEIIGVSAILSAIAYLIMRRMK